MLSDVLSYYSKCEFLTESSEKRGQSAKEHVQSPVVTLFLCSILIDSGEKHIREEYFSHKNTQYWENTPLDGGYTDTEDNVPNGLVIRG